MWSQGFDIRDARAFFRPFRDAPASFPGPGSPSGEKAGENAAAISCTRLGWLSLAMKKKSPPLADIVSHNSRWQNMASPVTTAPLTGRVLSIAFAAVISFSLPSAAS